MPTGLHRGISDDYLGAGIFRAQRNVHSRQDGRLRLTESAELVVVNESGAIFGHDR